MQRILSLGLSLGLSACALGGAMPEEADEENDTFLDGAADSFSVKSRSAEGHILDAVRHFSLEQLTGRQVRLPFVTALNIVGFREGEDGVARTEDDRFIASLEELEAIPYTGRVAWERLQAYASRMQSVVPTGSFFGLQCNERGTCEIPEDFEPLEHLIEARDMAQQVVNDLELTQDELKFKSASLLRVDGVRDVGFAFRTAPYADRAVAVTISLRYRAVEIDTDAVSLTRPRAVDSVLAQTRYNFAELALVSDIPESNYIALNTIGDELTYDVEAADGHIVWFDPSTGAQRD